VRQLLYLPSLDDDVYALSSRAYADVTKVRAARIVELLNYNGYLKKIEG
jgi:hypothetical protein